MASTNRTTHSVPAHTGRCHTPIPYESAHGANERIDQIGDQNMYQFLIYVIGCGLLLGIVLWINLLRATTRD